MTDNPIGALHYLKWTGTAWPGLIELCHAFLRGPGPARDISSLQLMKKYVLKGDLCDLRWDAVLEV